MWKRILKNRLKKLLDSDEFEDLIITAIKAALPDFNFTDVEKDNIKSKLLDALLEFIT
jgi:hypothetical protein